MEKQNQQELELLNLFRQMNSEIRDIFLSHGRIALVAEESGKRAARIKMEPPKDAA
jgi:hypothetical protein